MVVRWSVKGAVVVEVEVVVDDGRLVLLLLWVLLEVLLEREEDLAVEVGLTLLINESCWW